jgi:hypothetical protein
MTGSRIIKQPTSAAAASSKPILNQTLGPSNKIARQSLSLAQALKQPERRLTHFESFASSIFRIANLGIYFVTDVDES